MRHRLFDDTGGEIDTAMVVRFAGPASATGDDLVELHLHGGVAVVAAMLRVLAARPGLVLAGRGAFARRAFDNNRLDLGQVEGLADLIDAETESQRRQALRQAGGELHHYVDAWRRTIVDARANIEAALDFADEDDVTRGLDGISTAALGRLRDELTTAMADAHRANQIRDGVTVAIVGPVNVGKSSLVNALAARDVAIVTEIPGTTRDVIEVRLDLGGVAVTVLDTAGVRLSIDRIELEGIRRGEARAAAADLVVAVDDDARPAELHVVSKCDRSGISPGWHEGILHVSSVTGDGIAPLITWLTEQVRELVRPGEPVLLTRQRHTEAVKQTAIALDQAIIEPDLVLVSEHLRSATNALDLLIGRVAPDDLLDSIFARFCIGK